MADYKNPSRINILLELNNIYIKAAIIAFYYLDRLLANYSKIDYISSNTNKFIVPFAIFSSDST